MSTHAAPTQNMLAARRAWCLVLFLLVGCSGRPGLDLGEECELNSECASPLVCRLGHCREECRGQRDCAAGRQCVRDQNRLGACQLREEESCERASDCPDPLICQFGHCTNACNEDRDCPSGARCLEDDDGTLACLDMAETECTINSDCLDPLLVCAVDGRCREECRTDRDCRDGLTCRADLYEVRVCAGPDEQPDAGSPDAGMGDAGPIPDGGMSDAGALMPPAPPRMAAGFDHTCASRAPAETACWGSNSLFQIGDGTMMDSLTASPLAVAGIELVGAGAQHSCVASATELRCWGNNTDGQVGIVGNPVTTPATVPGLPTPLTDLALGSDHSCAIANARLFCWGSNTFGQLGTGDRMPRASPTEVTVPATPLQVSTFGSTTCVRVDGDEVWCFGDGNDGQIGDGNNLERDVPTQVTGITDAIQVAAGSTFACALRVTGQVVCWGNNLLGQLGDGMMGSRNTPTPPIAIPGVVQQIAVGSAHACARTASELYCWGDNQFGQCGIDPSGGLPTVRLGSPTLVPMVGPVDAVGVGFGHTCVRRGSTFDCFGRNASGQLGNGTTSMRNHLPQPVMWP